MRLVSSEKYRRDIDGLRAIAVIAVIFFHFGWLPFGYLGVDVFFVISGFLITWILQKEVERGDYSVVAFYMRRVRRILPLSAVIVTVAMLVGILVMLPDDLENLSASVIATNVFSNNILQVLTTKNYWDVVNEYKPLMHTWSLGVEEQYYFVYPFLFSFFGGAFRKWLLPVLILMAMASFALYLTPVAEHFRFYLLPFRFFELAAGGIASLLLRGRLVVIPHAWIFLAALAAILCVGVPFFDPKWSVVSTVLLSIVVVISSHPSKSVGCALLKNRIVVFFGLISYSLYMWHQLVLAYYRYFVAQEITPLSVVAMFALILVLSAFSYRYIEIPFRDRSKTSLKAVLIFLFTLIGGSTFLAAYCYLNAGVIRNVPELDLVVGDSENGDHAAYNVRIYNYDKNFGERSSQVRVLVIGNSYARDWGNVLLESKFEPLLELSYIYAPKDHPDLVSRVKDADLIFLSNGTSRQVANWGLPTTKLFIVGTKNFGVSNGIFFNRKGEDYFKQRTLMEDGHLETNRKRSNVWGDRYIDLIEPIIDERQRVPVFTPDKKFISQDTRHLTQAGARYYADLLNSRLQKILEVSKAP